MLAWIRLRSALFLHVGEETEVNTLLDIEDNDQPGRASENNKNSQLTAVSKFRRDIIFKLKYF